MKKDDPIINNHKKKPSAWTTAAMAVLLFLFFYWVISSFTKPHMESTPNGNNHTTKAIEVPTSTMNKQTEIEDLFKQMDSGGDKAGTAYISTEDGHIQALKQDDETWVVTQISNSWPEAFAETGVKKMSYDFIREVYSSDFPIKQVGMTINGGEGKYYRVFLGMNQAKANQEWQSYGPTNFYKWISTVETNKNQLRENSTYIEENL